MHKSIGLAIARPLSFLRASWLLIPRPSASSAAQIAKAMASACLADEVLTHLGDFLDDRALCALACSERLRWDRSASQRQTRKDEQLYFLQLQGNAECAWDCECAAELQEDVAPFVRECFWGGPNDLRPDVWFHIEFISSRSDLPQLPRAVKTFLLGLRGLDDLHVLSETLTFHDEYTGYRTFDDGVRHEADILRRLFQKLIRCATVVEPYPHNVGTWTRPSGGEEE